MKTIGKKCAALLLAAVMLATTVFCTEVPVSAETLQATIDKSRVTTKIQEAGRYSIRIQWDMSRLASGYAVYRKENGQSYKRIATVGKNVLFEQANAEEQKGYNKMMNSSLDSTKLEALGWKALFSLQEGTSKTIQILKAC